ncbi:C2 calcium-dependent domain-containing protein 4C [Antennarius striatus]|uniref:C2 calcium-dependent domain-containing protein 4C n=1 Tax=Antennarius striatus TaxID=241820 RepID=UPI0035B2FC7D
MESVESIPLELSRYTGKSEDRNFFSSTAGLPINLHSNILTPNKIPDFFLPPRLCKRSPLLEADKLTLSLHGWSRIPNSSTYSDTTHDNVKDEKMKIGGARKAAQKPLPFSAEGYGLAGTYEPPNTRRKESLFHSKRSVYMLDKSLPPGTPRTAKEKNLPKKTWVDVSLLFFCKSLSETGETASSSDSSPLSPTFNAKSSSSISSISHLRGAISCPSLIDSRENRRWGDKGEVNSLTASPSCPPSLGRSVSTLAPPVVLSMDGLQCKERFQCEHILLMQGGGKVHLFAEQSTSSTNTISSTSTVRVRVVSVEGIWNDSDRQALNCSVNLCLTPGRLQQQETATIKNSRHPVFNEDFFFTELSSEDMLELQLRIRVVNKPARRTLKRGTVMGKITKPLSQLLTLKNDGST